MTWVDDNNNTFTNPYNFVSLDSACERKHDYVAIKEKTNLLTGYISIEIKTESPIFIPNTTNYNAFGYRTARDENGQDKKIKSYDFFSYEDISNQDRREKYSTPVIPGSEIRGVIRSAFEAVTSSCLSTIDEERLMYKRTVKQAEQQGRLSYDNVARIWNIQPCERIGINTKRGNPPDPNGPFNNFSSYYEGQEVYIKISATIYRKKIRGEWHDLFRVVEKISDKPENGFEKGYVHHGEPFGNRKHHESIFIKEEDADPIIVGRDSDESKDAVKRLLENIKLYKDDTVNIHIKKGEHKGYLHLGQFKFNNPIKTKLAEAGVDNSILNRLSAINSQNYSLEAEKLRDLNKIVDSVRDNKKKLTIIQHTNLSPQSISKLEGALVYYKQHNGIYYLSPSAISREVFKNRVKDIAEKFTPCESPVDLCATCALFGMVNKQESVSSRIRFTDALPVTEKKPEDYFDNHVIFEELASPKPSATEFYLKKPQSGADIWNYDYALENQHDIGGYTPEIRGRKFYWHKKNSQYAGIPPGPDTSDRNVGGRPVKKGESFESRIYFNDITKNELKKLVWVLRPRGNSSKNYHKIGMGKPIGLGSIKIDVKEVMHRKIEFDDKNKTIKYYFDDILNEINTSDVLNLLDCDKKVYDEFLAITDFDKAPENFSYPIACDQNGEKHIYLWFGANKNHKNTPQSRQFNPIINKPLPKIAVTDGSTSSLPAYSAD